MTSSEWSGDELPTRPAQPSAEHGKEAEELRAGIERLIRERSQAGKKGVPIAALHRLLDDVDARDSLAYLERKDEQSGSVFDQLPSPPQPTYMRVWIPKDAQSPAPAPAQPTSAAEVLTVEERKALRLAQMNVKTRDGAWAQAPELLAIIDRLASELAAERERADKELDAALKQAHGITEYLRESVREAARDAADARAFAAEQELEAERAKVEAVRSWASAMRIDAREDCSERGQALAYYADKLSAALDGGAP